jgi:hypothetical protein
MTSHEEDIDRYLNGTMEEKEKESFLRRLEEDAEFRQEYIRVEQLVGMVRLAAMQEHLDLIHSEMEASDAQGIPMALPPAATPLERSAPLKKIAGRWWLAAAAVILLLVSAEYIFTSSSRSSGMKIFAAWYEPQPGLPTTMGAGQKDSRLMEAMVDYKTKEYRSAIVKFRALLTPSDTVALFYLASSYLGAGQYDSSCRIFGQLAGRGNLYSRQAQWYEALSFLALGKKAEAQAILKQISEDSAHPMQEKAGRTYEELRGLKN